MLLWTKAARRRDALYKYMLFYKSAQMNRWFALNLRMPVCALETFLMTTVFRMFVCLQTFQ